MKIPPPGPKDKELIAWVSRLESKRCLEPEELCDKEGIRAHSIPNSAVLSLLCENDHVLTPQSRMNFERPDVQFMLVGRNKASTFSGLCAKHDAAMFREIEQSRFDPENAWHRFLVTYRAAIRQLHADIGAALRLQAGLRAQVERGRIQADIPSAPGLEGMKWLTWAYETYEMKRELDRGFLERDPSVVRTRYCSVPGLEPTVAASSLITAEVPGRALTSKPPAFLSVIPERSTLHVVVGSLTRDAPSHRNLLRHLFGSGQRKLLGRLSRIILKNCENFVLAPSFYNSLDEGARTEIHQYFFDTTFDKVGAGRSVPSLFRVRREAHDH